MKFLITGGAGFIGTSIAEHLAPENDVTLLDLSFEAGKPVHYSDLLSRNSVASLEGDIRDTDIVAQAVADADVIIHVAAIVGVYNVLKAARTTIETNLLGSLNLIREASLREGQIKRFIYFSTSEVFGGSSFRVDESQVASIGSVNEARWSYSISKLAGEHLAHAYHKEFGLPLIIVRPFNVFGPRRTGDHAMIRFISAALRGDDLVVHGDGSQVRSWCYIDDFVAAILAMLEVPEAIGDDFNIGNALNTLTIYRLAKRVIELTDSSSRIVFKDIDYSDIDIRVPSTMKAARVLGYDPQVEIEEGITRTVEWYREHPETLDLS